MGFFKEFFAEQEKQKLRDIKRRKAGNIATSLGEIKRYGTGIGSGYNSYEYNDYNLRICLETHGNNDKTDTTVYFNKELVLSYDTYIKGVWEELIDEIYLSIPQIKKQEQQKKYLEERKEAILNQISRYDKDITFGNGVRAEISKREYSSYGTALDEIYRIYDENRRFIGIGIMDNKKLKRDVIV